jgi:hypothetical protein
VALALELPGWVVTAFWLIGLPWPGIDEDQLRAWAASVRDFAAGIEASSARTGSLTAALAASSRSSFTDTLASHWEQHHKAITWLRDPMDAFADALDAAADAVTVQKGIVIGAAITLAGEVIATQGEALFTFGLAEAEVPAEVALTRTIVKIALQDLEAELIGKLVNGAAADITAHLSATIRNLLGGAVSVTLETASLKIDYTTLRSAATTARSQAADTEETGAGAYSDNAGRDLDDPGAGGRWPVAQIVEQALLSIAADLFKTLPHTLSAIQDDTAGSLDKAATTIENTDTSLAGKVPHSDPAGETQPADDSAAQTGKPKIDVGKQGKHIIGHNNFISGRSELTADPEALAAQAGTGDPVNSVPRGQPGFRERVNFGEEIGTYVDTNGNRLPTSVGIIHYAKGGSIHIVPARPVP